MPGNVWWFIFFYLKIYDFAPDMINQHNFCLKFSPRMSAFHAIGYRKISRSIFLPPLSLIPCILLRVFVFFFFLSKTKELLWNHRCGSGWENIDWPPCSSRLRLLYWDILDIHVNFIGASSQYILYFLVSLRLAFDSFYNSRCRGREKQNRTNKQTTLS